MYCVITDKYRSTSKLPLNTNSVIYSRFKEFEAKIPFKNFAIKYVSEGCETYQINGRKFHVTGGQYLLANHLSEGSVHIDSKQVVTGICINLSVDILSEVVASSLRPDTTTPDYSLEKYFTTSDFLENQYSVFNTKTGRILSKLNSAISKNPFKDHRLTNEFYFDLAENLINDQKLICKQMQAISSIKIAAKKDLTRRVMTGKSYIDTNFKTHITIEEIARECGLSEYHFHRLFKTVYKTSPYQHLLTMRLKHALEKLRKGNDSLTDIAYDIGFADIYSFSKAFKKQYGVPPSAYHKNEISTKFSFQDDLFDEVTAERIGQIGQ